VNLAALTVVVVAAFAQQGGVQKAKSRRLESLSWNSVKHELSWVVSGGEEQKKEQIFRINMDAATMSFNGETRGFSKREAANVRVLMDILSRYAIESTVWWEDGQGDKLDDKGRPVPRKPRPKLDPEVLRASAARP
jgi:hypothetical protein